MGFQVVIKARSPKAIESALGSVAPQCEIFPMGGDLFGLSIPTKIFQSLGDGAVKAKLALLEHFDLWRGTWCKPEPKPKWKLW